MGLIILRNGSATRDRRLDRIPQFDERSRRFGVAPLLPDDPPVTRRWVCEAWLDQGAEGACVGFGFSHELAADPVVVPVTDRFARHVYTEAKRRDDFPGENYEGTSVLAGAKTLQAWGYIPEFRWAFTQGEWMGALSHLGPLVLGFNWYGGMFEPDSTGYLRPTGNLAGGHCICALGLDMERGAVRLRNSWGRDWGDYGEAWITINDFERLRLEHGDICIPMRRSVGTEPETEKPKPKKRPLWKRIFGVDQPISGSERLSA